MKKLITIGLVVVLALALTLSTAPVFAGIGKDIKDMGDNGKHYNLNIIGVPHDKTVPTMTGSNRHTIFVPLDTDYDVVPGVKIYFQRNLANPDKFQVLDGNATDDGKATIAVPFEDYGTLSYNVYATALGKFGGKATVIASVTFEEGTEGTLLLDTFTLRREKANTNGKGKPVVMDISNIFRATGTIELAAGGTITFTNVWVFNVPTLVEYLWDYENDYLRLMQVRFYETTSGSWD